MDNNFFKDKVSLLYDIYKIDINTCAFKPETYWHETYGIDSTFAALARTLILCQYEENYLLYPDQDKVISLMFDIIPKFVNETEYEILNRLYDLIYRICDGEYHRCGVLDENQFINNLRNLPTIFDFETPFECNHEQMFDKDYRLSIFQLEKKYKHKIPINIETLRESIFDWYRGKKIDYDDYTWRKIAYELVPNNPVIQNKILTKTGKKNQFDYSYAFLKKFFTDEGRKK